MGPAMQQVNLQCHCIFAIIYQQENTLNLLQQTVGCNHFVSTRDYACLHIVVVPLHVYMIQADSMQHAMAAAPKQSHIGLEKA